ncbi:uncharacterized protein LOC105644982 [Jatropha curcas]|uniref:uncharacterized protein LOC105644982 n=1 Tax=Jatropha curcas TaxID=180498 RepID=UPI0005FAFDDE|nr:uncharacterized protein LOC105644982 [Jatropha curcas]
MSHHRETNPHFIRPLQQREGQYPRTPPPPQEQQKNQPSAPHPKKHQRQHGPQVAELEGDGPFRAPWKKPQEQYPHPDEGPSPSPDDLRGPQLSRQKQKNVEQFPKHQGQRSKPYGPRVTEHPEGDGKFRSPWMLPQHQEDHGGHNPPHDGEYRSPWMLPPGPPQKHDHDHQSRGRQPKEKDEDDSRIPLRQQHDHRSRHRPLGLRAPAPQKTRPITWLGAALCAIFWIVIFLGGLIVLIVYLVYRPRNPRFEVSSVTLNAAYIDADALLNADISLLANFTNPNKKVSVDFNHMIIDLYYGNTLIATQYIESFSTPKTESRFANIHMISSQVRLPLGDSVQLQNQISKNGVIFDVKGSFKVRSNLGIFRYSYRLYGHCKIMVTAPPSGVLRATRCTTKR